MWDFHDIVDTAHITCNDICAMLTTYGVEAARSTIVQEISSVFAVYGISVDPRHLSLIADYMTQSGDYKAFNRIGMKNSISPFQKMSFETTTQFLTNACLFGESDHLVTPSAKVVMGQVISGGTGAFDLLLPLA